MNEQLKQIARASIAQSRAEGCDESDTRYMAIGAVVREGRNQGVISEMLTASMVAAVEVLIKQVMSEQE